VLALSEEVGASMIVECPTCGIKNRVADALGAGRTYRCGSCKVIIQVTPQGCGEDKIKITRALRGPRSEMRRFLPIAPIACIIIGVWLFVLGVTGYSSGSSGKTIFSGGGSWAGYPEHARQEMAAGAVLIVCGWFLHRPKRE
jgi:hypothetical protein